MTWATRHVARLVAGETVTFRPQGNSMRPRIESGQLCTVAPADGETIRKGDVVLCTVRGKHYLHTVQDVKGGQYLIGNERGGINGWVGSTAIHGVLTLVDGRAFS